jgi:TolB-like protein
MERPFPAYSGDEPYIFVSYSHDDAIQVYPEITHLKDQGFKIWYDEGITPGSTWSDEVALALTQCKVFLYFITPRSVASTNCLNEVNFCQSRERKILSVHLEQTELPIGLELSLSAIQAIVKVDHTPSAYQEKLKGALRSLLPSIEPIEIPGITNKKEPRDDRKSIAILPLANRSSDPENDYLCDGISEELINGLTQVDGLRVISAFSSKDSNINARKLGEQYNAETMLSGSVQKSGDRVRINVRLDITNDGSALWSERYDRQMEDLFDLQEDVAREVINALRIQLSDKPSKQLVDVGTNNIEAYNHFMLGLHEFRKATGRSYEEALVHFEKSVSIDPQFGRAYWVMYLAYLGSWGINAISPQRNTAKAEAAIRRANELQSSLIPLDYALGNIYPETKKVSGKKRLSAVVKSNIQILTGTSGNTFVLEGVFHL